MWSTIDLTNLQGEACLIWLLFPYLYNYFLKRKTGCLLLSSFVIMGSIAQPKTGRNKSHVYGKSNTVSLGIDIPFGNFNNTHLGGIAVDYTWTDHPL